jgi:hypothetical protein
MLSILASLAFSTAVFSKSVPPLEPTIVTSDIDRFYHLYDRAGGHPTANDLQRLYIDAGSRGMHDFVSVRGLTGANLSAAIEADARPFDGARQCVAALPRVRARVGAALERLRKMYPSASFPRITVLIGRGKTGGTTSRTGVLIGIETLCSVDFLEANREDRIVHLIAHEYAHVQQPGAEEADQHGGTVLFASLIEGGAEFVGELTSGGVSYPHLQTWTKGRERQLLDRFVAQRDSTDLRGWLYNGLGTPEAPGDLGYWAGYQVTKSYYERARDKHGALADILGVTPQSASRILEGSGLVADGLPPDATGAGATE